MEVWDVGNLRGGGDQPVRTLTGDTTWIHAVVVTANGKALVGASGDGLIFLTDLESGTDWTDSPAIARRSIYVPLILR